MNKKERVAYQVMNLVKDSRPFSIGEVAKVSGCTKQYAGRFLSHWCDSGFLACIVGAFCGKGKYYYCHEQDRAMCATYVSAILGYEVIEVRVGESYE